MSYYYEVDIGTLEEHEFEVGIVRALTGLPFVVIEALIYSRKQEIGFVPNIREYVIAGYDYRNYIRKNTVKGVVKYE